MREDGEGKGVTGAGMGGMQPGEEWGVGDPLESTRDLGDERLSGHNGAKCPTMGRGNSKCPPPVGRLGLKWRDGVTNPQSKLLSQDCSCLKELERQKWRRDMKTVLYRDCLLRGSTSSWLRQMQIPTPNHWTEVRGP